MNALERQIRLAQRRIAWNLWWQEFFLCLFVGATAWLVANIVSRLWDLPISVAVVGAMVFAFSVIATAIRTRMHRLSPVAAAAALDQAAGLRERLSSGYLCRTVRDPFFEAVVADAERVSGSITVRQHLRLTTPRHLSSALVAVVLAFLSLLLPAGLLVGEEKAKAAQLSNLVVQTQTEVKRSADAVRRIAETTPGLEEFKDEAESLDTKTGAPIEPEQLRVEAAKRIDNLADVVKQKRGDDRFEAAEETRKMLRGVKSPENAQTPSERLAQALADGDPKAAKEAMEQIKEQLAVLKSDEDKEAVEKLSKQLEQIAQQIEKPAADEKLADALKQAGLKQEDVDRALESLNKKDLDQLKKELEKSGVNAELAQKLAKQLAQKSDAGTFAKQLAQKLKQSAGQAQKGQTGEAMESLSMASEQLSQLEQLQQEAAQLDSALASLDGERGKLGETPCSKCQGSGQSGNKPCGSCGGRGRSSGRDGQSSGGGMGGLGRGRGGIAPQETTAVGFKTERQKVHTGKGAIIGEMLFDGEQVKGEVTSELVDVVAAGEREASDRISRDRVPRQAQGAVKTYFTNVQDSLKRLQESAKSSNQPGIREPSPPDGKKD